MTRAHKPNDIVYSNGKAYHADVAGALPADRAAGLRPEPAAQSQPDALIPSARPKRNDPDVRKAAIASLAADCAKWDGDETAENIADWIDCFRRVSLSQNGYEIARDLDNYSGVQPDGELVEILESGSSYLGNAHDKAVEAWVAENGIRPSFADGQRVLYRGQSGVIRGGEPSRGVYYFIPDGEEAGFANGGGVCVDYELAQAIEARQGGNGEAGAVHESPTPSGDAP